MINAALMRKTIRVRIIASTVRVRMEKCSLLKKSEKTLQVL